VKKTTQRRRLQSDSDYDDTRTTYFNIVSAGEDDQGANTGTIVIFTLLGVIIALICAFAIFFGVIFYRRRQEKKAEEDKNNLQFSDLSKVPASA